MVQRRFVHSFWTIGGTDVAEPAFLCARYGPGRLAAAGLRIGRTGKRKRADSWCRPLARLSLGPALFTDASSWQDALQFFDQPFHVRQILFYICGCHLVLVEVLVQCAGHSEQAANVSVASLTPQAAGDLVQVAVPSVLPSARIGDWPSSSGRRRPSLSQTPAVGRLEQVRCGSGPSWPGCWLGNPPWSSCCVSSLLVGATHSITLAARSHVGFCLRTATFLALTAGVQTQSSVLQQRGRPF